MDHVARHPASHVPPSQRRRPNPNSNPTSLMPPLPLPTAPPPRALCHARRLALKPLRCRRGLVRVRASGDKAQPPPSRTQMIMDKISSAGEEVGGAGGAYSYDALKRLDQICASICSAPQEASSSKAPPQIVTRVQGPAPPAAADPGVETFDVLVCGGTLGIFMASALSYRGLRVGIVERGAVKGREQEWNISRKELMEIVQVGILSEAEAEQVVTSDFNPNRCGFEGKGEIWVEDILHLGISPAKLVEIMKARFILSGGAIFEGKSVSSISVHDDLAVLNLSDGDRLRCRLVVDAMGNFSPIVRQIRSGRRPDGLCLVVGACARGFEKNTTSDVIFSSSSVKKVGDSGGSVQLFWEAFPAGSGPTDRTTYMFTYVDPQFGCPKLEELLEMF